MTTPTAASYLRPIEVHNDFVPRCFGDPRVDHFFSCRNLCPWFKNCEKDVKEKLSHET